MAHTPTPYKLSTDCLFNEYQILAKDNQNVCRIPNNRELHEATSNAAFIVQACNSHDALLSALQDLIDPDDCSLDHHGHCQAHGWLKDGLCPQFRAKAAIALARGE